MFIKRNGDKFILLVSYVDDCFGVTNDSPLIDWFNSEMKRMFDYKDLCPINTLLGTWVDYLDNGDIRVSSPLGIEKLLDRMGMKDSTPVATPLEPGAKLKPAIPGEEILDPAQHTEYQALIGSLLFLAISCRPDIAHAVHELGRFVATPTQLHWNAARRVL